MPVAPVPISARTAQAGRCRGNRRERPAPTLSGVVLLAALLGWGPGFRAEHAHGRRRPGDAAVAAGDHPRGGPVGVRGGNPRRRFRNRSRRRSLSPRRRFRRRGRWRSLNPRRLPARPRWPHLHPRTPSAGPGARPAPARPSGSRTRRMSCRRWPPLAAATPAATQGLPDTRRARPGAAEGREVQGRAGPVRAGPSAWTPPTPMPTTSSPVPTTSWRTTATP